jgi:hypothetical protein
VSRLLGTNTNSLKIRHTMQKNMVYLTEKITATTHATIGQLFFSWSPRFTIVFGVAAPCYRYQFAPGGYRYARMLCTRHN